MLYSKKNILSKSIGIFILLFFVIQILFPITTMAAPIDIPGLDLAAKGVRAVAGASGILGAGVTTLTDSSVAGTCDTSIAGVLSGQVIVCGILLGLNNLADALLSMPLGLSEDAVHAALEKNRTLNGKDSFIQSGWPVVRDISNIFFVFILLWIALATIFDIETYSAKTLLPKFIISALLINFSLPIAVFIISLSNQVGEIFFSQLEKSGGIEASVKRISAPAQQIAIATRIVSTSPNDSRENKQKKLEEWVKTQSLDSKKFDPTSSRPGMISYQQCVTRVGALFEANPTGEQGARSARTNWPNTCKTIDLLIREYAAKNNLNIYDTVGINQALAKAIVIKLIILPVIIFVLLAVAVLLVVRYISLLFIVVLGPFAFLAMILPATEYLSKQWWEKLVKWSLFSPAFAICFLISIQTMNTLNDKLALTKINGIDVPLSGAAFIDYLLSIGFMLGSLLVAQELGIHGAGTAINLGKRASGAVGNWAKNRSMANVKRGAGKISETALKYGGARIPLARTLLARTAAMGEKTRKQEEKRRLGFAANMPAEARAAWLANKSGSEAAAAIKMMDPKTRKETYKSMDYNDQKRMLQKLRGVNSEHLIRDNTGDPRIYLEATEPTLKPGTKEYDTKIAEVINQRKLTPSPEFVRSKTGRLWLRQSATAKQISDIGSTVEGVEALRDGIVETINGVKGEMINASDFHGNGAADLLRTGAIRALLQGRERTGPLQELRAAIKMETPGQTIPKEFKEPDKQDELKESIEELKRKIDENKPHE